MKLERTYKNSVKNIRAYLAKESFNHIDDHVDYVHLSLLDLGISVSVLQQDHTAYQIFYITHVRKVVLLDQSHTSHENLENAQSRTHLDLPHVADETFEHVDDHVDDVSLSLLNLNRGGDAQSHDGGEYDSEVFHVEVGCW